MKLIDLMPLLFNGQLVRLHSYSGTRCSFLFRGTAEDLVKEHMFADWEGRKIDYIYSLDDEINISVKKEGD